MQQSISSIRHYFMGEIEVTHYIKGTLFIWQYLSRPSIITSDLWLIWEGYCLFEESYYSPAPLKVPIYSKELVTISFVCTNPILS